MLRFTSFLLGYDYRVIQKQTILSRQKIKTLGILLMLPVGLWAISAFLLAYNLLETSLYMAIGIGVICALAVYVLDRSFITTSGNEKRKTLIFVLRIFVAILSALLGSVALELTIFSGDVANYQEQQQEVKKVEAYHEYMEQNNAAITKYDTEIEKLQRRYENLENKYHDELQGRGSKDRGNGPIAKAIEKDRNAVKVSAVELKAERDAALNDLKEKANTYAQNVTDREHAGIMDSVKDLHAYVFSDRYSAVIYLMLLVLLLIFELMVLLYKYFSGATSFENMMIAQEAMHERQLDYFRTMRAQHLDAQKNLGAAYYDGAKQQVSKPLRRVI